MWFEIDFDVNSYGIGSRNNPFVSLSICKIQREIKTTAHQSEIKIHRYHNRLTYNDNKLFQENVQPFLSNYTRSSETSREHTNPGWAVMINYHG